MKTITLRIKKNAAFLIGLILFTIAGHTQTAQIYNTSGSFTAPAGVTTLQVEAWGAGGAGGGNTTNSDGGGGGGGGAYSKINGPVTSGTVYTITVGTGGVGSTGDGTDGGDSSFGSLGVLNAIGGEGGKSPVSGLGGVAGVGGSATLSVGTTKFSGGNGGTGRDNNTGQGGPGGSSAGTAANGTTGPTTWSTVTAAAAPTGAVKGGNGGTNGNDGVNGGIPGAGGGGAGEGNKSGGDGGNGRVIITYTCPTYALTAAATATGPFCGSTASTVTLRSSSMATGTYTVTYSLTGSTGLIGATATMLFTAGSPGTGTFTTPALNPGTTTITVTNLASGTTCSNAIILNNIASVFEVVAPTAVAGTAINTCSTSGAVNITAGSSASNYNSIAWTSSGTGTFVNAGSMLLCTYNPSAADIAAGSITLTLTATGTAPCTNITSTKTFTIYKLPTAVAGAAMAVCNIGAPISITAGSSATNYTAVNWTSSGTGTFANQTSLTTATYTPSAADITAGSVTLTLTASNPSCSNATATKILSISTAATAVAGTAIVSCSTSGAVNITAGSSATNYSAVTWTSSGTGTFANANSLTTCTYTASAADIAAGSVTLTLTATATAPCSNAVATKVMTINQAPIVAAGAAMAICYGTAANITAGSSALNYSTVTWTSSGTGAFANATSLTTCTYNPSAADKAAGSVTLTLTAVNAGCANAVSTKVLTISSPATAVAGPAMTGCATGAINITAGSSASNYSVVTWSSSGTGTFANATSLTTCSYSPSAADIASGNVTITLTASNAGCANAVSTKTLTIFSLPTAVAGPAMTTCTAFGATNITAGSSATNQTSVTWTSSGTGTFANANSLTTCTYNPSAADISAGSVLLTLTAFGNAPCGNVTSTKTLTITVSPSVTGTTPGSRTGTGTVILGASASLGTLNWYAALTGGTALGTGTSFTTPVISTTTTFYVEAANGACSSSPRTAVVATVNYTGIDIQGNATSIINGSITPSTTNWTDFGTTNPTRTFTIRNIGAALLTVGTITISGANASEFTVTTAPASVVGVGGATTFIVTFSPTVVGLRTAMISIVNNDPNKNPYSFAVQGTGVAQEIDIQGNATSIVAGDMTPSTSDWTDFGTVAGTRTFTIYNTGNVALTIGAITISGTNAADFTVTTLPAATVGPNSSTTFVVTFNPSAINTRTATLSIANNDNDENPYVFAINGFGIIPEIDIQGNATSIPDSTIPAPTTANWTDFSSTAGTRTFTILNQGNIALTIGAITFTGANASEFTVTTAPASTVAAFSSTTFVVTFLPTAIGPRSAAIHIVNNDSNENPYDFNLQGTGVPREIDLQGLGLSISSGDIVPSVNDGTDFGPSDINFGLVTRTFTITNTGSLSLTISNPTISGTNASEFSITANPGTLTILAGSSTTFQVTFNPSVVFTRVAQINIVNDDSDENPYFFAIQGTGTLDSDGDGIDNNADLDDDNDGIVDIIECGTCVSNPFVNGSFETPVIGASTYSIAPSASVPGWNNSSENFIEIWSTGFNGVPSAAGNQFAELNANVAGNLYQTFCLNAAGGTINWAIKHRGRSGTDVAAVRFGPNLATLTTVATMTDGTTSWGSYSGTYAIPVGQTSIVLAFTAISSTGGLSYGNFIDDVQIIINQNCVDTDGDGIADVLDVDSDNDGIPDIEEAGFKQYSNNTATMDKTNPANWKDLNGNGINDYIDAMITAGTYSIPDTDGDGVYNHLDLDSDNDSLFDVDEAGLLNGDGDINDDGKGDGADTDGDGLLNLFDNATAFGSAYRPYAQDSDLNGIPDYLQLDANDDGINDIQTGLYGSYDANGDGKIDGSVDADHDGITDAFDTNNALRGSPRDLNRKLYLDFDGRNDYAEDAAILGGLSNATLMAWVDMNSAFSGDGFVVGQDKFYIRISAAKKLEAAVNGTTLTYNLALNTAQWYHVAATYGGGNLNLYLNGKLVATQALAGSIAADVTKLTLGKNPAASNKYFKGKIDEVRVFNAALTASQVQRMVYQEIQNTASQVRGTIVPKDVGSLPFANVLKYYRMDTYKDDIVDNLTTAAIDTGTGMKLYNHKVIAVQQAPMPFTTIRTGDFATAINDATKDIRGLDATELDYSIIQVKHNITEPSNNVDLAMFVDPAVTIAVSNDNKIQNDWYLKLDGKIDLQGRSQLVQTINSDLEVTSAGSIERDQKGQSNKFNYNYWSSPVGSIGTTSNNNAFTVNGVLRDGTNPSNIQPINWIPGYNGAATSPISLSNYWIFKFQNLTPLYANWSSVGPNGILVPGQGYTMKGSDAATPNQNYTFVGKPNNGVITSAIAAGNANLSGNPYPSALDANAFITANSSVITGTLYFWEHFSTNTSHNLLEYQGGYSARNLVGGTSAVAPAGISGSGSSTRIPGRYIPVGQGFLVYGSSTGGTITFDNSQRGFIKEDSSFSNEMFRTHSGPVSEFDNREDEVPTDNFARIRLGFNAANGAHRQILLGFMDEHATSGFDIGYDAPQIDNQPNEMAFAYGSENWVIQGDGFFNVNNSYPLSVKTGADGDVNFTLDATENFDASQEVYIYDSITDTYNDIRNEAYHVTLPIGTLRDRFSLRFKTASELATNSFIAGKEMNIQFSSSDNTLTIANKFNDVTVISVDLYNMLGQSIDSWNVKDQEQSKIQIPVKNVSTGTYVVKVHTTKGDVSKKIIIR